MRVLGKFAVTVCQLALQVTQLVLQSLMLAGFSANVELLPQLLWLLALD